MIPNFVIEYNLYDLRLRSNHTVRELAAISGISKTQINSIEDGNANPTLHTICALSLALNVTPDELFSLRISP